MSNWILLIFLGVKSPDVDYGVLPARDKPSVIIEPRDPLDWLGVCRKLKVKWAGCRVKLVNPDFFVILACEQVASVTKHDLTAFFDWQGLILVQSPVEDVH